jgi:anti-sigma B factor antagonist
MTWLFGYGERLFRPPQEALAKSCDKGYAVERSRRARKPLEALMQLRLSTRTIDGVLIVDCGGRIVFGEESASLRDTVKKLIPDNKNIVLNLGGVNYIDSGGLGTLVALYTTAHNAGGSIKLANLTQRVGDLLQVTKLLTVFQVYDSEEQAVQSFSKTAAA